MVILKILKYLWQLPQHIAALCYLLFLRCTNRIVSKKVDEEIVLYRKKSKGSMTLGMYIFASKGASWLVIKHETGHTKQSLILGPLYLIVIGIPSLLWALTHKYIAPHKSYYWFYTESWANKLGGISV